MAINRVTYPSTPTPVSGDWDKIVDLMQTGYLKMENALRIDYDNDNVLEGAVFHIGGDVFLADSDTAITGTPSDYVQLTVSGSTASAAYVANLTGVSWSSTYNGYYDVSGNLYIFKETDAYFNAEINSIKTEFGDVLNSLGWYIKGFLSIDLTNYDTIAAPEIASNSILEINNKIYRNTSAVSITGSTSNSTWYDILLTPSGTSFTASYVARGTGVWDSSKGGLYSGNNRVVACVYKDGSGNYINKNILVVINKNIELKIQIGDWNMDSTGGVNIDVGINQDYWKHVNVLILADNPSTTNSNLNLEYDNNGIVYHSLTQTDNILSLARATTGDFDNAGFDSTSYNRGWIYLSYEV